MFYECFNNTEMHDNRHIADLIYTCTCSSSSLFIDRIDTHIRVHVDIDIPPKAIFGPKNLAFSYQIYLLQSIP